MCLSALFAAIVINNLYSIFITSQAAREKQVHGRFTSKNYTNEILCLGIVMLSKQLSAPPRITSSRRGGSEHDTKTARPRLQKRIRSLPPQREVPKFSWL